METRWKEADCIYAAGFLDGEGRIGINRGIRSVGRDRSPRYELSVSAVNTNEEVLLWFVKTFGGTIRQRKVSKKSELPQWRWHIGNRQAEMFLKSIVSYLKVKKEQAKVGIEFMSGKTLTVGAPGIQTSPEQVAWREEMYQRISGLNNSWKVRRLRQQRLSESTPNPQTAEVEEAIVRTASKDAENSGNDCSSCGSN